jgi:hypothetical protein
MWDSVRLLVLIGIDLPFCYCVGLLQGVGQTQLPGRCAYID